MAEGDSEGSAEGSAADATTPATTPALVIFIGLPAAGKSTYYARRFATTHALVSNDAMPHNKRPERRQRQLIAEALAAGRSVVVDNTNLTLAARAPLIALAREHSARVIGYEFASTRQESLTRNARRADRARVPDVAIYVAAARFVPPSYAEGFDALYRVRIGDDGADDSADIRSDDGATHSAAHSADDGAFTVAEVPRAASQTGGASPE